MSDGESTRADMHDIVTSADDTAIIRSINNLYICHNYMLTWAETKFQWHEMRELNVGRQEEAQKGEFELCVDLTSFEVVSELFEFKLFLHRRYCNSLTLKVSVNKDR